MQHGITLPPGSEHVPLEQWAGKKRVLLLSERFGAGHSQAAHALAVSLRKLSPHVQTRVIELGSFLNPKVAPVIIEAYRRTVTVRPKLVGFMYKSQYRRSLNRLTTLALHRVFYTHAMSVIRQLKPDMIVCTHPIPSAVISRLRKKGLRVPLYTLITDYDAHAAWISPDVSKYLVSTPEVKQKLLEHGVQADHIHVTGIPVHPKFWEQQDREAKLSIRAKFNLKDMPTVLVMGGGWGMMDPDQSNELLTRWSNEIQFVFCTGDNEKLRKKLLQSPRFQHAHVHVIGYTNEVDQLMDVSDLLVTKPGGMTCTEALAKGIPMLFYKPLPGQEEENCLYFTQKGYGEPIESPKSVTKWMNMLVHSREEVLSRRREYEQNASRYHPQACAKTILTELSLLNAPQAIAQEEANPSIGVVMEMENM
ncbi:MGDG synthase family glycosyltransferase [Paenibacillus aquistagni]|uniref:MGDG synthase family glycosyltransferase n=1 Tax=Paenibacillus aquistagni TaxID=1852522 RepID=UPI00145AD8FA|nr:glycosyltransferase [Paenibacillus aquistagni]NMM54858.1 glycosyltransferase [Paenibacillus aquistagni]